MSKIKRYRTLALIALPLLFAACESAKMKAEHEAFVHSSKSDWDKQRLMMMYQVAEQQYKVGELDKCRTSIAEALQADTPYAPFHVLAAKVNLEGGSLDEAGTHLRQAIAINSTDTKVQGRDPEPYYLMGVVYQRTQKFEEAGEFYQKASDKKPSEATYAVAVAEMLLAQNKLDEAKEFLENKLDTFEQSASMRIALARIATMQGDAPTAAGYYRDVVLLLPDDKNLRWSYAEALFDAGKYSATAKILEELRLDPPVLPKATGKAKDQASSTTTDVSAARTNQVRLLMTLGECYLNLKRTLDARDCFQEVIRIQPENISAFLALGKVSLVSNDLNFTQQAAQRVLRLDPDNIQAMILQAAVEQKEKKWTQSLETLVGAARIAPKDATVLCMAGISSLQLGKKNAAIAYFEQAVAANPTDTWAGELLLSVKPPAPVQAVAPAVEPAVVIATPEPVREMPETTVESSKQDVQVIAVPILPDAQ